MAFWSWSQALPPWIQVHAVDLPGRDSGAPGAISSRAVAEHIAARAPGQYALYGHSMGARLAFEVSRELVRLGAAPPTRLYVGAAHPPHLPEPLARLANLNEDEFVEQLIQRAGTPTAVRDDLDVRAALMPALRADLLWLKQYRYRPGSRLPMPVVAFAGTADREVSGDVMIGWAKHTSAWFRLHTVAGDHLFLHSGLEAVTDRIAADLAAATTTTATRRTGLPLGQPIEPPSADEIHVWWLAVDRMPGAFSATHELSPQEAARAVASGNEVDRRRYIARCVMLRRLLSRYGVDVGSAELPTGRDGKPHLGDTGLRFSLSHSAGTVVVAFTRDDEVGVDVERLRPMADFEAFCDKALTPPERAEVFAEPGEFRLQAALRFWTAKQAVLKASGDGLTAQPVRLDFAGQPPDGTWLPHPPPGLERLAGWRVTHLPMDGAVAAVATRRERWRLRFETIVDGDS